MERFAQYIKNEYSINDFDDDDFALIIVDCGADCAAAKSLHAKTLTAKCSSLIEAEYVLPFIAAKKRAIKKGEEFAVTIADAAYTLRADDKGRIDCVRCTADAPPENALSLELADFTALFFADASVFGRNEDALKQKDAEIAKLKTDAERQIAEIKTEWKNLKLQLAIATASPAMFLRGGMNDWGATEMSLDTSSGEAIWTCAANLPVGVTEFKISAGADSWDKQWGALDRMNALVPMDSVSQRAVFGRYENNNFVIDVPLFLDGEYIFIFNETEMTVQVKSKR